MSKLESEFQSASVSGLVELWNEYEDQQTPEARFVKGLDAFIPILLNFINIRNSSWVEHQVQASQVQKRLDKVRDSIGYLAGINDRMIQQAVSEGKLL